MSTNKNSTSITTTTPPTALARVAQFVTESRDKLSAYLPPKIDRERFMTSVFLAFDASPELQAAIASPQGKTSVMSALRLAACKGLSLNPQEGLAGFIAYAGKVEYRVYSAGLIALAIRDGHVREMRTRVIFANDKLELGEDEHGDTYRLTREIDNPGDVKGFLAIARIHDNTVRTLYMSAAQVDAWGERYGSRRKDGSLSPMWRDSFEGAGQKTVARQLLTKLHVAIPGLEEPEEVERVAAYVVEAVPEREERGRDISARGTSADDVKRQLEARGEISKAIEESRATVADPTSDADAEGMQAGTTEDGRPF